MNKIKKNDCKDFFMKNFSEVTFKKYTREPDKKNLKELPESYYWIYGEIYYKGKKIVYE